MAIKNYTTKITVAQTAGEIQAILATHGARKIMMDYNESGSVTAVTFQLSVNDNPLSFRIVAKSEGVMNVMKRDGEKCTKDQAERIAWRNVKDWIAAQIALIETEQATMEELFLPNMLCAGGMTFFEAMDKGMLQIGDGT